MNTDRVGQLLEQLGAAVLDQVADEVMRALDQSPIGAVLRRRFAGELPALAAPSTERKALSPAKTRAAKKPSRRSAPAGACAAPDCDRPAFAAGYCRGHYERKRLGKPIGGPIRGRQGGAPAKRAHAPKADADDGEAVEQPAPTAFDWRRNAIAPILATPKDSRERKAAILSAFRTPHLKPDGRVARLGLATIRKLVEQAETAGVAG